MNASSQPIDEEFKNLTALSDAANDFISNNTALVCFSCSLENPMIFKTKIPTLELLQEMAIASAMYVNTPEKNQVDIDVLCGITEYSVRIMLNKTTEKKTIVYECDVDKKSIRVWLASLLQYEIPIHRANKEYKLKVVYILE